MIALDIPGRGSMRWEHLVLDLNGTLALDGSLIEGVAERTAILALNLRIHLLTADTHGTGQGIAGRLGVPCHQLAALPGESERMSKQRFVEGLGADRVVAIGNGANDAGMLEAASLGIAVLGAEGAAVGALVAADVVAPSVADALDLLLHPQRLLATLRC
jgi:P-type E1-E2 ATPase